VNVSAVSIQHLSVTFDTPHGAVKAVDDVTLTINPGERSALLGESGCGKSVLALAMMQLLPRNARIEGGITVGDRDIIEHGMDNTDRGSLVSLCWSNAERFFNPVMTIGDQIIEAYTIHHPGERPIAEEKAMNLLTMLGFDDPLPVFASYPFQLSGGMNQRAMIAMSIINDPAVLLVDEPTRGLDDTNRERVMTALDTLDEVTLLLITHDVDCAIRGSQTAFIMRNGAIVDSGETGNILVSPYHPYTKQLVRSCPHFWGENLPLTAGMQEGRGNVGA